MSAIVPLFGSFASTKSTRKINAVHERSVRVILNDYKSPYALLLEEAHQITFHQRCINSLMIEVYKYLNGHSPDIMNDIFRLYVQSPKLSHLPDRKPSFIEIWTPCYFISC